METTLTFGVLSLVGMLVVVQPAPTPALVRAARVEHAVATTPMSSEAIARYTLSTVGDGAEEPPLAEFSSTKASDNVVTCSIKESSESTPTQCSVPKDAKKCSTQKAAHPLGHQCSVTGQNGALKPECSVLDQAYPNGSQCSVFGGSTTPGSRDVCSVMNNARAAALCSALATGAGSNTAWCSVDGSDSGSHCSVASHSNGGKCSVYAGTNSKCTVLSGTSQGTCSLQSGSTGHCSVINGPAGPLAGGTCP